MTNREDRDLIEADAGRAVGFPLREAEGGRDEEKDVEGREILEVRDAD